MISKDLKINIPIAWETLYEYFVKQMTDISNKEVARLEKLVDVWIRVCEKQQRTIEDLQRLSHFDNCPALEGRIEELEKVALTGNAGMEIAKEKYEEGREKGYGKGYEKGFKDARNLYGEY